MRRGLRWEHKQGSLNWYLLVYNNHCGWRIRKKGKAEFLCLVTDSEGTKEAGAFEDLEHAKQFCEHSA